MCLCRCLSGCERAFGDAAGGYAITAVTGLIANNKKSAYRETVDPLVASCSDNGITSMFLKPKRS